MRHAIKDWLHLWTKGWARSLKNWPELCSCSDHQKKSFALTPAGIHFSLPKMDSGWSELNLVNLCTPHLFFGGLSVLEEPWDFPPNITIYNFQEKWKPHISMPISSILVTTPCSASTTLKLYLTSHINKYNTRDIPGQKFLKTRRFRLSNPEMQVQALSKPCQRKQTKETIGRGEGASKSKRKPDFFYVLPLVTFNMNRSFELVFYP